MAEFAIFPLRRMKEILLQLSEKTEPENPLWRAYYPEFTLLRRGEFPVLPR